MAGVAAQLTDREESKDFAALLGETLGENENFVGQVVTGTIVAMSADHVTVDVGLKSEGRIPLKEFGLAGTRAELTIGDAVEVYVDRLEDKNGEAVLSREKARREEAWAELEVLHDKGEHVTGVMFGKVKGGFTVDLNGAVAFLPGSQVDVRPIKDVSALMGVPQPFQILKMDRARGNIVVSRRAILEETQAEAMAEMAGSMEEGKILTGIVKNITDYGAFVDLGGIDGLLHVTDISWKRVNHPSEALSVGQQIEVMVIRYNEETKRVSLGMKQLEDDPWENAETLYPVGAKYSGRISNVTDYGAFVELDNGIEGLVHVSEMSWTKKNVHPSKIVSTSQEVDVMVLDVDLEKRRISLGIKQTQENPWAAYIAGKSVGEELEGEVRNITEFGLFVGLNDEIDGMVHISDISWEDQSDDVLKQFTVGDKVKTKILEMDADKERVALGIKQLSEDPFKGAMDGVSRGAVVTCTVTEIESGGVKVTVNDTLNGYIKKADLSSERSEQRPDRLAVGEKVDAKIMKIDAKTRELGLSIKAYEQEQNKKAMEEYGSTESGASLGDILGAALDGKK